MRLLYVIDSLAPGGAETSLAAMAGALIEHGVDLHVLPLGARRDLAPTLEASGATVHPSATDKGRVNNVGAVLAVARAIGPDLIHTTLFESDVAGRVAAAWLGVPSSTSIVNDSYSQSHYAETSRIKLNLARLLDASTARLTKSFHSLSASIAEKVAPRIWLPPDRFTVVPRGRDPELFPFQPTQMRDATRREFGLDPAQRVILTLGRQEPQKGLQHLLAALPRVAASHPRLTVLLAGREGRSTAMLTEQASHLNSDVRFIGPRSDVPSLLAAADAFCFPSEREGFGGVLIEAMAVGCPIVASDIPTTQEVLGQGSDPVGILTPVDDSAKLAAALTATLDGGAAIDEAVFAARRRFEKEYSIESVAKRMVHYFTRAASS